MTDREKELTKYQEQYLNLVNEITRIHLSGKYPPEKLLKQAQEIGRKGQIPEAFFRTF